MAKKKAIDWKKIIILTALGSGGTLTGLTKWIQEAYWFPHMQEVRMRIVADSITAEKHLEAAQLTKHGTDRMNQNLIIMTYLLAGKSYDEAIELANEH